MAILYGDASPFPLDENFIETLRDATDICCLLLRSDEIIDEIREQVEVEKQVAERDHGGFNKLAAAINRALEPHAADESPTVAEVSNRLLQTAQGVLEGAVKELVNRRDARLLEMESKIGAERARIPRELERFLLKHELPNTQWGLKWETSLAGGTVQGLSTAATPHGIEATFELDIGSDPLWSKPVRIQEIKQELTVQLPHRGGWLGRGPSMREEQLDRYYLTLASMDARHSMFAVYRGMKTSSQGYEISIAAEGSSGPTVRMLDEQEGRGEAALVEGPGAAVLVDLWKIIASRLGPLHRRRTRLVTAALNGSPITDIDSPSSVARLLINAIAPYVREMVQRSPIQGEIVLKREVENGRREEMFVSISELTAKYSGLTPGRMAAFDELGLGKPSREQIEAASIPHPLEVQTTRDPEVEVSSDIFDEEPTVKADDSMAAALKELVDHAPAVDRTPVEDDSPIIDTPPVPDSESSELEEAPEDLRTKE